MNMSDSISLTCEVEASFRYFQSIHITGTNPTSNGGSLTDIGRNTHSNELSG